MTSILLLIYFKLKSLNDLMYLEGEEEIFKWGRPNKYGFLVFVHAYTQYIHSIS